MQRTKQAAGFLIFSFSLLFLAGKSGQAEPTRIMENLRREPVEVPSSAPDRSELILVGFLSVATDGETIAAVAIYGDPRTERLEDYWEVYDTFGSLLWIGWVDPFGIRRMAVDIGLLQADSPELEGVLVLITDGISL